MIVGVLWSVKVCGVEGGGGGDGDVIDDVDGDVVEFAKMSSSLTGLLM